MYYNYYFSIFMGLLTVRISGSLTLMPTLGNLFLLMGWVSNSNMLAFGSSSYIVFCGVWLLPLRSLFHSNEREKGSGSREEGRWGRNWKCKEKINYQHILFKKRILFSLKEKKNTRDQRLVNLQCYFFIYIACAPSQFHSLLPLPIFLRNS